MAITTAFALIAAASAYFLEIEPLVSCRQRDQIDDSPAPRSIVNVYVAMADNGGFEILVGQEPFDLSLRRYGTALCRFSNAGRAPLLGLTATLAVTRTSRIVRPDDWDGLPVETVERIRKAERIPLDHLTASDNESQRIVFVTVYRDVSLAEDTVVEWTGAAATGRRRFSFMAPPPLTFARPARRLPAVSVPEGDVS